MAERNENSPKKTPEQSVPNASDNLNGMPGKFHELDKKKLEAEVSSKLKALGTRLTAKELKELMSAMETSKNLDSLREKLGTKTSEKANDQLLKELLSLAESIRGGAAEGIKELRLSVVDLLKNDPVILKSGVFFSEKFPSITKLENSELGKNVVLDITGFAVGTIDTLITCIQAILRLLWDACLLPRDIIHSRKKP